MNKEILEMAFSHYGPKEMAEFLAACKETETAAPVKEVAETKPDGQNETRTLLMTVPEAARYLGVSERSITEGRLGLILHNENPKGGHNKYSRAQLEEIREKQPKALRNARAAVSKASKKMPFGYIPIEYACRITDLSEHQLHDIISGSTGLIDVKRVAVSSGRNRLAIREQDLRDYLKIF